MVKKKQELVEYLKLALSLVEQLEKLMVLLLVHLQSEGLAMLDLVQVI